MGRSRMTALLGALVLAALVALLWWGTERKPGAAERVRSLGPSPSSPTVPVDQRPPLQANDAAPPRAEPDAAISDVAQALRATDAHDRALLADIERRTRSSPPASAHELIAMRRRGASREELERFIEAELSGQLWIRVAAQRWLRAVQPRPGLQPAQREPPEFGRGGGPKLVKPIEKSQGIER
jgi:hypothetical protein